MSKATESTTVLAERVVALGIIGQAVGIIMVRRNLSSADAAAYLSEAADGTGVEIRALSRMIVAGCLARAAPAPPHLRVLPSQDAPRREIPWGSLG